MVSQEGNSDFLEVISLGLPPTQPRKNAGEGKKMKAYERIYLPCV